MTKGITETERKVGVLSSHDNVKNALEWLRERLETLPYGEVGLSFVIHDGRIARVRKIEDESIRVE